MTDSKNTRKIAILYVCTGEYVIFWKDFFTTCEKYFIPEMRKEYFVFTDAKEIEYEKENSNIHKIFQKNLGWPNMVIKRYEITLRAEKYLSNFTYAYFFNANTLFIQEITPEEFLPILPQKFVAWQHTWFFNKNKNEFTYDRNPKSSACIPMNKWEYYFWSGITGWFLNDYLNAIHYLNTKTKEDERNNIIALWHDESHWNKYLLDKIQITKILAPNYLYPEWCGLPLAPKILLRDKRKYGTLFFKIFIFWKMRYLSRKNLYHLLRKIKSILTARH